MVTLQELTVVLNQALSQEQANVKQAEGTLQSFETQPGYHHALATIFCDVGNAQEIRWMAVICLKNGVYRYWRKNAPGGIQDSEKAAIRGLVLQGVVLDLTDQLSLQLALVIAKIARFDFPNDWESLLPFLVANLDKPCAYQASLALYHVIKALSIKRLLSDRNVFYEVSNKIFEPILAYWKATTQVFLDDNSNLQMLQRSLLALKSLKLLLVHGGKQEIDVKMGACMESVFTWLGVMLKARAHYSQAEPLATVLTKWCLQCTKLLLEVQKQHTIAYIPYAQSSFEVAVQFAFNNSWRGVMFERCLVNMFNLLKACINEPIYRVKQGDELAAEVYAKMGVPDRDLVLEYFKDNVVLEFTHRLIFDFFPVSVSELEKWMSDPEEYATEQGGDLWKYSIRPCTESLFLTLFSVFRTLVQPKVMELIDGLQPLQAEPSFEEAQRRQAIYTAVGLASYNLYDELDFDNWFLQILLPELKVKHKNYLIVHRTILWLLGQWSDVKFSDHLRPVLYETLAGFMGPNENLVIRLSACLSIKTVVDHFNFKSEQFLPYLPMYMNGTFNLLQDLEDCEGKVVVLQTMTLIIERMESTVLPFVQEMAAFLPPLWDQSAEHNMLRCAIVGVLTRVVSGMSGESVVLYPITLRIVAHSVNVQEPQHVFLIEEGLELWKTVIEESPAENDELLELAKFIPAVFDMGSEHLEQISTITKLYVALYRNRFLSLFPELLCKTLVNTFNEVNVTGGNFILKIVDMAVRLQPAEAIQIFYPLLANVIDEIINDSYTRDYTTTCFSIWCRMLLFTEAAAAQLLTDRAQKNASSPEVQMNLVLDWWLKKMPNVSVIQTQKLMAITLLSILVSRWAPMMYQKFCAICLAVCEVLNDISETDSDGRVFDSLIIPDSPEEANTEITLDQSHHSARMYEMIKKDVAHTVVLSEFVLHQMKALAEKIGPQAFGEVLQEIDVETKDMLESYTNVGLFSPKVQRGSGVSIKA